MCGRAIESERETERESESEREKERKKEKAKERARERARERDNETFIPANTAVMLAPHRGCVCAGTTQEVTCTLQGYLAHKKTPPPRTLQQEYA